MKKILAAVAALAVLAGCKNTAGTPAADSSAAASNGINSVSDIAYVDIDSLIAHYDMYTDLSAEFETKAKKIEGELTSKKRRLEKEVRDYQEKASNGLMTRSQMAQTEEQPAKPRCRVTSRAARKHWPNWTREQQVMTNQVIYSIMNYIKEYNSNLRYKMILSTTGSGPVLDADPALNITSEILDGLNQRYVAEKNGNAKK
ncbi:MAG: OmpH family outer membrane protein [Alistipes putredinis]|nr:MAG: OmpH family outer membrane protein [Alistipes putredinis]